MPAITSFAPGAAPVAFNDNSTPAVFEAGRTYRCRSICEHDCFFTFRVISRTAKTVTIEASGGKQSRRKVRLSDGVEIIDPHGRYSMSPILRATDLARIG